MGFEWKNNQRIYTLFCPIDLSFDLKSTNADIQIAKPSFPYLFVENLALDQILNYAISSSPGNIVAFSSYSLLIPATATPFTCVSPNLLNTLYPSSVGQQNMLISFTMPLDVSFDSSTLVGFNGFKVKMTFSSMTGISYVGSCKL